MKPKAVLRDMAIKKALAKRERYTWIYDRDTGHFEIIDADQNEVIATAVGAQLRDEMIGHLSSLEHQPAAWSKTA